MKEEVKEREVESKRGGRGGNEREGEKGGKGRKEGK